MSWHLNLKQLEAFRAVILAGTTTRAASVLNLSQPAISRLIRDLEAQLGIMLFERHKGRLVPTRHATWLMNESEDTLARLDKLDNALRNRPRFGAVKLRLVANTAMAFGVLPTAIARFRNSHKAITISTDIVVRRDNRRWINEQNFDLAVTMLPIEYAEEALQPLARVPAVCILPDSHPLANRAEIFPKDLDGVELVSLPPDNLTPARLNRLFQKEGLNMNLAVEAQTVVAVSSCVAEGLGVGVVDPFTAQRSQSFGVVMRPFISPIDYLFGVVFPLHKPRSDLTDQLVELVRTVMMERVPPWSERKPLAQPYL